MRSNRKVALDAFFANHPVFSLDEATDAFQPKGGRAGMANRLRYHADTGRLKRVLREVYAVVPPGGVAEHYHPDPFLVVRAVRPSAVFAHHSALELLGVAHSAWDQHTVFDDRRRAPLTLNGTRVRFLEHPAAIRKSDGFHLGTRHAERRGHLLRVTGPERTIVEGFRRPPLAGGLLELLDSAVGFPALDLDLLLEVLECYATASLWAAAGWFLERQQRTFDVPYSYLARLETHRPKAPQYLIRNRRGGTLDARWNLILPEEAVTWEGPGGP